MITSPKRPLNRPRSATQAIQRLAYERKEFWRVDKPDLQPLINALRLVPADAMTRMALALGRSSRLWSPRRVKKSG